MPDIDNDDRYPNGEIPQIDMGWANWEGEPMDWLAYVGVGALVTGIAIALICDAIIRLIHPQSIYVSDVIRDTAAKYPAIVFIAGAVAYHLFFVLPTRH